MKLINVASLTFSLSGVVALSLALVGCAPTASGETDSESPEAAASELASRTDASCTMFNRAACLVNTASTTRAINVVYPNLSWCKVVFLANGAPADLDTLLPELEFSLPDGMTGAKKVLPAVVTSNGIEVTFGSDHSYIGQMTVRSVSGRSLDNVIRQRLAPPPGSGSYGTPTLIAVPEACPGR